MEKQSENVGRSYAEGRVRGEMGVPYTVKSMHRPGVKYARCSSEELQGSQYKELRLSNGKR